MVSLEVERDVAATGRKILRRLGFKVRSFADRRKARAPGVGDDYAQHAGKRLRLWVEWKRKGGKQRPKQVEFQRDELAAGGAYIVVDRVQVLWDYLLSHGFIAER